MHSLASVQRQNSTRKVEGATCALVYWLIYFISKLKSLICLSFDSTFLFGSEQLEMLSYNL